MASALEDLRRQRLEFSRSNPRASGVRITAQPTESILRRPTTIEALRGMSLATCRS